MNRSMNNSQILIKTKSRTSQFKEAANDPQKDLKNLMISKKKIKTSLKVRNSKTKIMQKVKFSTNPFKRKLIIRLNNLKTHSSTT